MTESIQYPLLTIIIPTYNRPKLLKRAVESALLQAIEGESEDAIDIVVVDDCSPHPVALPAHPRLKIVRLSENKGGAAARNEGARIAAGHYISYLDDDDLLLSNMANTAIKALRETTLPAPVAAWTGINVVNSSGEVTSTRLPPTLPKGSHFALEDIGPEESFLCKQTLVIEKDVLQGIGGFDESFQSRVHSELFLRLNLVCSLLSVPVVTYQLMAHEGPRVSRNPELRQISFERLVNKHRSLFEAHPKQFAQFVYRHAQVCSQRMQRKAAVQALIWAFRIHPLQSAILVSKDVAYRLSPKQS